MTIDGYTQPGASPNTLPLDQGDNAVLLIEINGSVRAVLASGLTIAAGNTTVRGLVINQFQHVRNLLEHQRWRPHRGEFHRHRPDRTFGTGQWHGQW